MRAKPWNFDGAKQRDSGGNSYASFITCQTGLGAIPLRNTLGLAVAATHAALKSAEMTALASGRLAAEIIDRQSWLNRRTQE